MSLPTGTVTFLFTDIEGSTQLWEQHSDEMKRAIARHNEILRRAIESHRGYVFKTVGDGFYAVFDTAPDALNAALSAQRALVAEPWEVDGGIRVRMALHTGDADEREGDYLGPTLNRIARILAAGYGGQTLLSLATEELVRDALPESAALKDLGEHRLRDLARPERIFQLIHPTLENDFPRLKSLSNLPNNLPVQLTSFIGREREITEIKKLLTPVGAKHASLLQQPCLVTLTGAGGCGKTRLALQVAADLLDEYPDGIWLVELASLTDPALVLKTVAVTVGVREESHHSLPKAGSLSLSQATLTIEKPLRARLIDHLRGKQLLLILDNCEHVVGTCAQVASELLSACPRLKILATSREALGISGETAWKVPSLSLPELRRIPSPGEDFVSAFSQYESVKLFIERAIAALPTFGVNNQNAPAVAQICHRLDGIPLAIELAAARLKVLSVEQIAARLDDRFRLLTGGSRTALPRQQTLRAMMDWSFSLLTEQEQALLRRLSVFAGGFGLEAAEAICADVGANLSVRPSGADTQVSPYDVLDLLTRLVDKSLVIVEERPDAPRYRLLETVRQYSRDKLLESNEAPELRWRHRDWFLSLVEHAEPQFQGPEQKQWLERLETEHDNLRVALAWSLECKEAETAVRLGNGLWWFWYVRGHLSEGQEWLERIIAESSEMATIERVKALAGASLLTQSKDDYERALALGEEALVLSRQLSDKRGMAFSLFLKSGSAWRQGYREQAIAMINESLALMREIDDRWGITLVLDSLARMLFIQGDPDRAEALLEESLELRRKSGDKLGIAGSLGNLGTLALMIHGDYSRAKGLLQESLELLRELEFKEGIAETLSLLGIIARDQGDYEQAKALSEESLALRRELGERSHVVVSLRILGLIAAYQNELEKGLTLCAEALALARALGDKETIAATLNIIGGVRLYQGDYARATSLHQESFDLYEELGDKNGLGTSLYMLGFVAHHRGDYARAEALHRESLSLFRESKNRRLLHGPLEGLGAVARVKKQCDRAVKLFAIAGMMRERMNKPIPPPERILYEYDVEAARATLGPEAFDKAWTEGRAMTLEQAIEFALQDS